VRAAEHGEDPLLVGRSDADAVVGDRDAPAVAVLALGAHGHVRRPVTGELQRVGDEVLQDVDEQVLVGEHARQRRRVVVQGPARGRQGGVQVAHDALDRLRDVDRLETDLGLRGARVPQQPVDEVAHPPCAVGDLAEERPPVVVEPLAVPALDQVGEAGHRLQRLDQVVRGCQGEALELGVRARELLGRGPQGLLRLLAARSGRG
jgi:hypothetical protein